ncbi:MAG: cellulose synthase family protein [Actinomycetota bacterium]
MLPDLLLIPVALVYIFACALLFFFGINLIAMSIRVWRRGPKPPTGPAPLADADLPFVTVQLPIFNELYVSRRIIEAACGFDYPMDRFEIQVLDDSTDETSLIVAEAVAEAQRQGVSIEHIQRSRRTGYKAGALAEGMHTARGEFVAIFDADFVPQPCFLRRALPHFDQPNVAFVQARWGHVNRDYSWLTRLQSLAIDGHFLVEQAGRGLAGYWFNFNGTAGVWRTDAIADAGGWKADTLTEDLDLSYRAHLRGWRARYVEDLVVPAEVPVQLTGFRRQQHRWARGSLECLMRLLPSVWRSGAPLMTRVQATFHLGAYVIQLLLLLVLLIYPLVVLASRSHPGLSTAFGLGYAFAAASLAPTIFFITGSRQGGRSWWRDFGPIVAVTAFGAGLMVNTARAALQIRTRPNPSFERTAKFGVDDPDETGSSGGRSAWAVKRYQLAPDRIVLVELALGFYALFSAWLAAGSGNWGVFVYAVLFALGLFGVSCSTIAHTLSVRRHRARRDETVRAERASLVAAGSGAP